MKSAAFSDRGSYLEFHFASAEPNKIAKPHERAVKSGRANLELVAPRQQFFVEIKQGRDIAANQFAVVDRHARAVSDRLAVLMWSCELTIDKNLQQCSFALGKSNLDKLETVRSAYRFDQSFEFLHGGSAIHL